MAKKQIIKSFEDLASAFAKQINETKPSKIKKPRIIKQTSRNAERVYTPEIKKQIEIPNSTIEALKDLNQTIKNLEKTGTVIPEIDQRIMRNIIRQNESAFNRTPIEYELPVDTKHLTKSSSYTSNDFGVKDYFKPQQYRGIDNIDAMFEEAANLQLQGFNNAALPFGSAGLSDAAKIITGSKPTSFKYKSNTGIVPKPVLQEITIRRNAPAGTMEWLQQINAKNPDLSTSYLDLFSKYPDYFKSMFDSKGNMIK